MNELITQQKERSKSLAPAIVDLIEKGKPAALALTAVHVKKSRYPKPVMFIVPMDHFGGSRKEALFALQGGFSEVLDMHNPDPVRLWKVGLTTNAAKALIKMIREVVDSKTEIV